MSTPHGRTDDDVRAEGVVSAPQAFLAEALSNAALMPRWWSAGWHGCTLSAVAIEPWPGGSFRIEATEPDGVTSVISGEVISLTRDQLRATWKVGQGTMEAATVVSIKLRAADGGHTHISLTHEGVEADARTRVLAFWRRVLKVMSAGVPRLAEMHASPLGIGTDPSDDAALIAAQVARLASGVMRVLGPAAPGNTRAIERAVSPRYAGGSAVMASLAKDVADKVQALFDSIDIDLIPPSIGFGSNPEVRVSPNAGSSDLPGGYVKAGAQIDINPRGSERRPIGRFSADVHFDEGGRAVGATVGWQCRF